MVESVEQVAKVASAVRDRFGDSYPDVDVTGQNQQDFERVQKEVRKNLNLFNDQVGENLKQISWGLYFSIIAWIVVAVTTVFGYYDNLIQIATLLGITFLGTSSELGKKAIEKRQGYVSLKRAYQIWSRGAEMAINNCSIKAVSTSYAEGIQCLDAVNKKIGDAFKLLKKSGEASEETVSVKKELQEFWK
ncbi:MAG: hypothetical protein ACFFEV_09700 [Candidatus Thorarchaeota archaeon]